MCMPCLISDKERSINICFISQEIKTRIKFYYGSSEVKKLSNGYLGLRQACRPTRFLDVKADKKIGNF